MDIKTALNLFPGQETELMIAELFKRDKTWLFLHPQTNISSIKFEKLSNWLVARKNQQPLAQLFGYKYFYGYKFKINNQVLIPRPESEWLVQQALTIISQANAKTRILDMGTGSGCLAISIYCQTKIYKPQIFGVDKSKQALAIAKYNSAKHRAKIKLIKSNLWSKVKGKYELIIANLPYVPQKIYYQNKPTLDWEPEMAITDGSKSGLELYKKFIQRLPNFLTPNGQTLMEIDPSQKKQLLNIVKSTVPTATVQAHKDLSNRWRYLTIELRN